MYVIMADVCLISNEATLDPDRELEEDKKPGVYGCCSRIIETT
jgi:hypothetical protein